MSARKPDKAEAETVAALEPHQQDVAVPQTDDDLNAALEDSFPASDPINLAGSVAGIPPENEIAEADDPNEATPPVGTHPMGGARGEDADVGGPDDAGGASPARNRKA